MEPDKPSLFNVLKQQFAGQLQPQLQHKTTLITLSHAIEEAIIHNNLSPVIFVGFQKLRYYQQEQPRYEQIRELAYTLSVYGEDLSPGETYDHDWFVVVNEPRLKVVMASYELEVDQNEAEALTEGNRPFLGVWSYNPDIVDFVSRYLAQNDSAEIQQAVEDMIGQPYQPLQQIRLMSNISDRILSHMERAAHRTLDQIGQNHRLLSELQHQANQINDAKKLAEIERDTLSQELKHLYSGFTRSHTILTDAIVNRTRLEKVLENSKVLLQQLQAQLDDPSDPKTTELLAKINSILE